MSVVRVGGETLDEDAAVLFFQSAKTAWREYKQRKKTGAETSRKALATAKTTTKSKHKRKRKEEE
jgi:hypothetical protein